jgi:hypothetical protein
MASVAGQVPADTAVIQYWLGGAASHQETYDPKPDAPIDFRGPFRTIPTNVSGIQICETLPRHAKLIDKVTLIRSMGHDNSDHQHGMHWCQTGHDAKANGVNPFKGSNHPSSGSVMSKVRRSNHPAMPAYVHIGYLLDEVPGRHYPHSAAYLVRQYDPYVTLLRRGRFGRRQQARFAGLPRDGHLPLFPPYRVRYAATAQLSGYWKRIGLIGCVRRKPTEREGAGLFPARLGGMDSRNATRKTNLSR